MLSVGLIAGGQQASQWRYAHGRAVGDAVILQFCYRFPVANRVQGDFRRRPENVFIEGVKAQRPVENVPSNQVRVDLAVAFQQSIRQTERH